MDEVAFASRPPIDSYGNGGFKVGGLVLKGSILLLPDRVAPWPVERWGAMRALDFADLLALSGQVDFVLVGTGDQVSAAPKDLRAAFVGARIGLDVMPTGAACRTYNVLLAENRRMAAALIAVP